MPLHRADRDLPALTVLALLLTGPRHTYEMHRETWIRIIGDRPPVDDHLFQAIA